MCTTVLVGLQHQQSRNVMQNRTPIITKPIRMKFIRIHNFKSKDWIDGLLSYSMVLISYPQQFHVQFWSSKS